MAARGTATSEASIRGRKTARPWGSISPQTMITRTAATENVPAAAVRPLCFNSMPMTEATAR